MQKRAAIYASVRRAKNRAVSAAIRRLGALGRPSLVWQDRRKYVPVGVQPQANLFSMSSGGRICSD